MKEHGYVYILSLTEMPGTIKIGCSMYGGTSRARDIKYKGIDSEFKSEFELYCLNYRILEQEIHKVLDKYRHTGGRELFDMPINKAIRELIDLYLKKYMPKKVRKLDESA